MTEVLWSMPFLYVLETLALMSYTTGSIVCKVWILSVASLFDTQVAFSSISVALRQYVEDMKSGVYRLHYSEIVKVPGSSPNDPKSYNVIDHFWTSTGSWLLTHVKNLPGNSVLNTFNSSMASSRNLTMAWNTEGRPVLSWPRSHGEACGFMHNLLFRTHFYCGSESATVTFNSGFLVACNFLQTTRPIFAEQCLLRIKKAYCNS